MLLAAWVAQRRTQVAGREKAPCSGCRHRSRAHPRRGLGAMRPPAITKFAGIVVLDNPRLRLAGPTQKLEAPRDREQNAGWELVGGRNEHGARFWGRPDA